MSKIDDILLEGKLEDFIKDNNMSKDDALSDNNIKKLKRVLKLSADKTKKKVEKYFQKNPDASTEDDSKVNAASEEVEVPDEAKTEVDALPKEKKGLWKTVAGIIANAAKSYTAQKTGKLLDELFAGNFKDAAADIYSKKLDDDEMVSKAIAELKEFDGYKKAAKKQELDSRKDTETSTDVDPVSVRIQAMWWSKDKEANLGYQLNELVKQIQQLGKKAEDKVKDIQKELKKAKIKMSDEEVAAYAPAIDKLIKDKVKPADLKKKINALKKDIKEAMASKILDHFAAKQLNESNCKIPKQAYVQAQFEAVCENETMQEYIVEMLEADGCSVQQLVAEGWFKDMMTNAGKAVADTSKKAVAGLTKYSIGPIISLAGLGVSILTGGIAAATVIKVMDLIEKQGKSLRNTFERFQTQYANSKGVITKMDYSLKDKKDTKYSMRFYEKDMAWRVLNLSDQLKHPSKDYVKAVLNGEVGKKYRERLKAIWDPMFESSRGGKVDFVKLFEQAKAAKIPEKALQLFQQFAESYDKIVSYCIEQPKINTRTQDLKGNI